MNIEKKIAGTGPVALDYSTRPATDPGIARVPDDNMPELRGLLGRGRNERTILAAFVIRLRRQPVKAEIDALRSFAASAEPDRLLEEIDAMGEFPIASVADGEIRIPGE